MDPNGTSTSATNTTGSSGIDPKLAADLKTGQGTDKLGSDRAGTVTLTGDNLKVDKLLDAAEPAGDKAPLPITPQTTSPQGTTGSPAGPPQPVSLSQQPSALDADGRPIVPAHPAAPLPTTASTAALQNGSTMRPGGSTFQAPPPAHANSGPIWRYAPDRSGQGGTLELGMLDGLLTVTIHPDGGRAASVRLPRAAALELQMLLAQVDLR